MTFDPGPCLRPIRTSRQATQVTRAMQREHGSFKAPRGARLQKGAVLASEPRPRSPRRAGAPRPRARARRSTSATRAGPSDGDGQGGEPPPAPPCRLARRAEDLGDWNNVRTAASYLDRSEQAVRALEKRGLLKAERIYLPERTKALLMFRRETLIEFYPRLGRAPSVPREEA